MSDAPERIWWNEAPAPHSYTSTVKFAGGTEYVPADTIADLEAENQRLREALEPFAFLHPEDPEDSAQKAWETVYLDRVKDWIDYEEIAAARAALEGE
jgi:hypothetical protein